MRYYNEIQELLNDMLLLEKGVNDFSRKQIVLTYRKIVKDVYEFRSLESVNKSDSLDRLCWYFDNFMLDKFDSQIISKIYRKLQNLHKRMEDIYYA